MIDSNEVEETMKILDGLSVSRKECFAAVTDPKAYKEKTAEVFLHYKEMEKVGTFKK
jgi:hypothetical protein